MKASPPDPGPARGKDGAAKARGETQRILERLRLLVYLSDLSQRDIERRIGFSRGYLSQLFNGLVEIKIWQLLAVIDALAMDPGEFFAEMFPRRRHQTLEILDVGLSKIPEQETGEVQVSERDLLCL